MTCFGSAVKGVSQGRWLLVGALVVWMSHLLASDAFADCLINGSGVVCVEVTNSYTAAPSTNVSSLTYSWLITNDTAGTVFLGNTNSASVQVLSATNGAFSIQC